MIDLDSLAIVIPVYQPTVSVRSALRSFHAMGIGALIVVDDGSDAPGVDSLLEAIEGDGARVIRADENRGIAASLNSGVTAARSLGVPFLLTLDQDSMVDRDSLRIGLTRLENERATRSRVWAVTPARVDGHDWPTSPLPGGGVGALEPLQSGTIIDTGVFDRVGQFREDLVIDAVDTEFWLRMLCGGLQTDIAPGYELEHEMGEALPVGFPLSILFPGRTFSFHGPVRRYYMTRNRLIVLRTYAMHFPSWASKKTTSELIDLALSVAYGTRRPAQILSALVGVRDFVLGRTGKAPAWLARL